MNTFFFLPDHEAEIRTMYVVVAQKDLVPDISFITAGVRLRSTRSVAVSCFDSHFKFAGET